jgi:hypothetical protein
MPPFSFSWSLFSMLLKEAPFIYKLAGGAGGGGVQKGEANFTTAKQAWSSVCILYLKPTRYRTQLSSV